MTPIVKRTAVMAAVAMLSACSGRIGNLSMVSTKGVDLSNASLDGRGGKRVEGRDCQFAFLGLLPLSGLPNLGVAIDDALASAGDGSTILVDQVTEYEVTSMIVVVRSCIVVEGAAVKVTAATGTPTAPAAATPPAPTPPLEPVSAPEVPATAFTAGATAVAKTGASLRTRAISDAPVVLELDAGTEVLLKASLQNQSGKWWYATAGGRQGWILEGALSATVEDSPPAAEEATEAEGVEGAVPQPE